MNNRISGKGLLLAIGDLPDGGATAMRIRLLAAVLAEGGIPIEIGLIHPTLKHSIPENCELDGTLSGVRYRYLSGRNVRPATISGALVDTLSGILSATRLVLARGRQKPTFVIFYTPTFWKMIIPVLVARLRGIPIVVEACEIWSTMQASERLSRVRRLMESGSKQFEQLLSKWAKAVIAISTSIFEFYRKHGVRKEDIFLLPILVDVDHYRAKSDVAVPNLQGISYILNSGTLSEKDGVSYLVQAFIQIADDYQDLQLVLTGNVTEESRRDILRILPNESLRQRIIFVGFLRRDQLAWAYQHAVALLSCRPKSAFAQYGFPTKLGEYLAAGAPIIATRVGDIERYLRDGENAYLAEPENAASIAQCMRQILSDPEQARKVGAHGQDTAAEYFSYRSYSKPLSDFICAHVQQETDETIFPEM